MILGDDLGDCVPLLDLSSSAWLFSLNIVRSLSLSLSRGVRESLLGVLVGKYERAESGAGGIE